MHASHAATGLAVLGVLLCAVATLPGCGEENGLGTKETETIPRGDPTLPGAPTGPEIVRPPSACFLLEGDAGVTDGWVTDAGSADARTADARPTCPYI